MSLQRNRYRQGNDHRIYRNGLILDRQGGQRRGIQGIAVEDTIRAL